ncbi:MAG TPA: glycosyltransferase family 2 protein [Bacteroidales bacterium]|nr:glycosyltransferase family 2 protein [Bacteroidales bacterium]HSA43528.1 glycosyltransferase family 2 protein [Bacteroidales bacterium]
MKPSVSIIIPCFNEEKFLPGLISDIAGQDYPSEKMEVIFVDGMSRDKTVEIILQSSSIYPHFRLLNNPARFVPFALNKGIREAGGEIIIRMDAHARYPHDYISLLVKSLEELKADNVGGCWVTTPAGPGLVPLAIASVMSSVFGMGNAMYRLPARDVMQVDTVPFGCYRKEIFERIGYFDEALIRNQDDEFNARLIQNGGRIFLVPAIRITYFARDTIAKTLKMFYQYGLFKPLVNKKLKRPATLRQFIPPALVLSLAAGLVLSLINSIFLVITGLILALHLLCGIFFSAGAIMKHRKPGLLLLMPLLFLLIHLSYGTAYISGSIKEPRHAEPSR